ncbi:hypothetical protein BGW80DRAFT_1247048 [Lactifluus volemus]|nr:hypothetical protein BGW80DRAFT_1247048 [Lactifluus volemus]
MNRFKGKQSKHLKSMECARKRNSLVLTLSQSKIFEKNNFPVRDCKFITTLAEDLNLELTWDEYDEYDQNLVTFCPPGMPEEVQEEQEGGGETEGDNEDWTSDKEDEDMMDTVDWVLDKYRKAKVAEISGMDFNERYKQVVKDKMDVVLPSAFFLHISLTTSHLLCDIFSDICATSTDAFCQQ